MQDCASWMYSNAETQADTIVFDDMWYCDTGVVYILMRSYCDFATVYVVLHNKDVCFLLRYKDVVKRYNSLYYSISLSLPPPFCITYIVVKLCTSVLGLIWRKSGHSSLIQGSTNKQIIPIIYSTYPPSTLFLSLQFSNVLYFMLENHDVCFAVSWNKISI